MASLDAIAAMRDEADRELRELITQIGGAEAAERLRISRTESFQKEYNDARERQELVKIIRSLMHSGAIREETSLESLHGIGKSTKDLLKEHGYHTKADLRDASDEELTEIEGIGATTVFNIRKQL